MITLYVLLFGAIAILGALGAALSEKPYNKMICINLICAGTIPFMIEKGYLDIAIAIALIVPISTIVLLQAVWRYEE